MTPEEYLEAFMRDHKIYHDENLIAFELKRGGLVGMTDGIEQNENTMAILAKTEPLVVVIFLGSPGKIMRVLQGSLMQAALETVARRS